MGRVGGWVDWAVGWMDFRGEGEGGGRMRMGMGMGRWVRGGNSMLGS